MTDDKPQLSEIIQRHQEHKRALADREKDAVNATPEYVRAIEDIATYMTPDEVSAVLGRVQQSQTPWHRALYDLLLNVQDKRTMALHTGQQQPF